MNSIVSSGKLSSCTYYEDTADILDTLIKSGAKIETIWVQPPSESAFHNMKPTNTLTQTISIDDYKLLYAS